MPTSYTSLLGLALPVTGELSGTWGDTVNQYITQYVDAAVAGAQTISGTQTAVTLSVTNGASLTQAGSGATGSAQYQIINCTGSPASALTVTVPSASKVYLVLNNTSTNQTVTVKGAATTGVTVAAGRSALIAWNGTDFELVATDDASKISGILAVANGGTGLSSGTSGGVPYFSGSTTMASSAALAANALVVGGGAGAAPSTVTTGTGVVTALGVNTGSAGAFVVNGGALGTPSSGTVTNLTGTASININGTVGATTPNTGSFTTLAASSTVSGTGFTNYFASPPAIGGTAPNTGNFTAITSTSEVITGAAGVLTRAAATQDGVEMIGRAGGTLSYKVSLTPTTLTASRTLTLPDNSGTILTTGATVAVSNGGTGQTTYTDGQLLIGNTVGNTLTKATLTAGSGVSITNGNGSISISATGSGGTVTSVSWTGGIVSVANATTTPAFTIAGTSGGIPYFSSASTWATSAALAANSLVIGGGAGVAPSTTTTGTGVVTAIGNAVNTTGGLVTQSGTLAASSLLLGGGASTAITSTTTGTGVVTALGTNVGSAGAFVVNGGALGTPSSGTVTNLTGTASININGTVGATTPSTGSFTTLTTSSTVTINGGTANGVAYLNGSKVLTTGTGLVFDGTNLGLNATPSAWSVYKSFDVESSAFAAAGVQPELVSNAYFNGTNWIYKTTGFSNRYVQNLSANGVHAWFNAASGTAGTTATFTQAMTLDGDGNLNIRARTNNATTSFRIQEDGGTALAEFSANEATGEIRIGGILSNYFPTFYSSNVERGRFSTDGTFRIKGAGTAGSTDAFQVSGSAPASSLAVTAAGYTQPKAYADTVVAAGNTGTALTLTCTNGNVFTATLTGNATITLSSPIATGATSITLILTNDATAGRTVAWAGGSFKFPGGAASLSRTTTANAVDVWVFFTPDGGTTWYGNIAMKNMTA